MDYTKQTKILKEFTVVEAFYYIVNNVGFLHDKKAESFISLRKPKRPKLWGSDLQLLVSSPSNPLIIGPHEGFEEIFFNLNAKPLSLTKVRNNILRKNNLIEKKIKINMKNIILNSTAIDKVYFEIAELALDKIHNGSNEDNILGHKVLATLLGYSKISIDFFCDRTILKKSMPSLDIRYENNFELLYHENKGLLSSTLGIINKTANEESKKIALDLYKKAEKTIYVNDLLYYKKNKDSFIRELKINGLYDEDIKFEEIKSNIKSETFKILLSLKYKKNIIGLKNKSEKDVLGILVKKERA